MSINHHARQANSTSSQNHEYRARGYVPRQKVDQDTQGSMSVEDLEQLVETHYLQKVLAEMMPRQPRGGS